MSARTLSLSDAIAADDLRAGYEQFVHANGLNEATSVRRSDLGRKLVEARRADERGQYTGSRSGLACNGFGRRAFNLSGLRKVEGDGRVVDGLFDHAKHFVDNPGVAGTAGDLCGHADNGVGQDHCHSSFGGMRALSFVHVILRGLIVRIKALFGGSVE